MVVNLLSNAVKFTPPGGRIKIDARLASQSEHRRNIGGSNSSNASDNIDREIGHGESNSGGGKDASTTCSNSVANNNASQDPDDKALRDSRTGESNDMGNDANILDNDKNSDASSKRPSFNTSHKATNSDNTNSIGNDDPRSDFARKRPSFNTIHKKYFNLSSSNIGNPSKSRKPSLSTIHNSNFGVHNNFKNGLVVDLDGSNGLLALLGKTDKTTRR